MPLPVELVRDLPDAVVNELAILEDRALRAEGGLERSRSRAMDLEHEVARLREEVEALSALAETLQAFTKDLVEDSARHHVNIERELQRLLVLQAS